MCSCWNRCTLRLQWPSYISFTNGQTRRVQSTKDLELQKGQKLPSVPYSMKERKKECSWVPASSIKTTHLYIHFSSLILRNQLLICFNLSMVHISTFTHSAWVILHKCRTFFVPILWYLVLEYCASSFLFTWALTRKFSSCFSFPDEWLVKEKEKYTHASGGGEADCA